MRFTASQCCCVLCLPCCVLLLAKRVTARRYRHPRQFSRQPSKHTHTGGLPSIKIASGWRSSGHIQPQSSRFASAGALQPSMHSLDIDCVKGTLTPRHSPQPNAQHTTPSLPLDQAHKDTNTHTHASHQRTTFVSPNPSPLGSSREQSQVCLP
jgi:hypothetical protein